MVLDGATCWLLHRLWRIATGKYEVFPVVSFPLTNLVQNLIRFSQVSVCPWGEEVDPPQEEDQIMGRDPFERRPHKGHGTRQEVTSYPLPRKNMGQEVTSYTLPWYWHLVVATATVGTHPTGMHSCWEGGQLFTSYFRRLKCKFCFITKIQLSKLCTAQKLNQLLSFKALFL